MILILDCYVDDPGAAPNFARFSPGPTRTVRVPKEGLPSLEGVSAVMCTGSAASVMDDTPWVRGLLSLIRETVDRGIPYLGVCFGHQALGAALGGKPGKAPRPEVGWVEIELHDEDPLFHGVERRFRCFVSHEDEVAAPGGPLRVLGRSAGCDIHALRVEGKPAWGVQFHPEMPWDECEALVRKRAVKHPELSLDVDATLADAVDHSPLGERIFGNFFKLSGLR